MLVQNIIVWPQAMHKTSLYSLDLNYRVFNFRSVRDLPDFAKNKTAKSKPYYTSPFRGVSIAKIVLSENLTHLPIAIFDKISRREKIPTNGVAFYLNHSLYVSLKK